MTHNPALPFSDRLLAWTASWFAWTVLQFIGKTSRIDVRYGPGARELLESGRPMIYAVWHRFQLLPIYIHRNQGLRPLISRSRDGELIAQATRRLGYRPIRGSSSRGGGAALLEVLDTLATGGRVSFTPDGPRGPVRSVQPGIIAAAQKTGAPILPLAWAGTKVKELSSWDRFLVPKPFGRYAVFYGEPFHLTTEETSPEEKVGGALDAVQSEAEAQLRWNESAAT